MIPGTRPDLDQPVQHDAPGGANPREGTVPSDADAPATRPVDVDELKRAWRAVSAGDFQHRSHVRGHPRSDAGDGIGEASGWKPAVGERVVAVVGCVGSAGATTFALATALSSPSPARVVECCSSTTSGLAAAATAELGIDAHGWRQGRRDHVLLQRGNVPLLAVDQVRPPTPAAPGTLTILDVGWEATQLAASRGWLSEAVAHADVLMLVTPATTAGMRRLAGTLHLLTDPSRLATTLGGRLEGRLVGHGNPTTRVLLGVRGPSQRRWDRSLEHDAGPDAARLIAHGSLVEIPHCRDIAVRGLESRLVPSMLVSAARDVLHRIELPAPRAEQSPEQPSDQRPGQRLERRIDRRPETRSFDSPPHAKPSSRTR